MPQDPDLVWSKSRVYSQQALNMLHLFVKHCGKSPEELLKLQGEARKSDDPDAEYVVLNMVKGWISAIKGRKQTKLNYVSTFAASSNITTAHYHQTKTGYVDYEAIEARSKATSHQTSSRRSYTPAEATHANSPCYSFSCSRSVAHASSAS